MVLQAREAEYLFKIIQFNPTILIHPGQLDLFSSQKIALQLYWNLYYMRSVFVKKKINNRTSPLPLPISELQKLLKIQ